MSCNFLEPSWNKLPLGDAIGRLNSHRVRQHAKKVNVTATDFAVSSDVFGFIFGKASDFEPDWPVPMHGQWRRERPIKVTTSRRDVTEPRSEGLTCTLTLCVVERWLCFTQHDTVNLNDNHPIAQADYLSFAFLWRLPSQQVGRGSPTRTDATQQSC